MHVLVECAHACICAVVWRESLRCVSVEYVYVCASIYDMRIHVCAYCMSQRERKRERGREERLREVERARERERSSSTESERMCGYTVCTQSAHVCTHISYVHAQIQQHRERAHVRIHGRVRGEQLTALFDAAKVLYYVCM